MMNNLLKIFKRKKSENNKQVDYKENRLPMPNENVLRVCKNIRGENKPASIIIHGVMRRSGTNYVGDLLNLHPDLCGFPNQIWEVPFLKTTGNLLDAQNEFLNGYHRNRERIGEGEFLPLFGASFIAYLYSFVPEDKRMLLKVPSVEYIAYFKNVFPFEKAIVLQRDGRDVVASTIRTWPNMNFQDVCYSWKTAQEEIIKFIHDSNSEQICFCKFEDAVQDAQKFVKSVFQKLKIDDDRFPYDEIGNLPVKGSSELKVGGKVTWKAQERPKNFNPIGRWTNWNNQQKRTFKNICGETLIKAGYAKDMNW